MKHKFINALSLAVILAMLFTSVGLADTITTDGDTLSTSPNVSVTSCVAELIFNGSARINYQGGSHFASAGGTLNVSYTVDAPITVLGSATQTLPGGWDSSGDVFTFGFTTKVPADISNGTYKVTVEVSGPKQGGGTLMISDFFNINVNCPTAPSNTPPNVTLTGVTDGASYEFGSVPAATCNVTDAEDGNSSFPASLSVVTGPYAADGIGSQTASCFYEDAGGLTASASVTYSIGDPSAPSIAYILAPPAPDGSNDWYKSDVSLTWIVTENESPSSLVETGCVDQNINADQADTTYSCSASSAGGSAAQVDVSIKRDATAPTISGSATPAANSNGWNNSDVNVSFTCDDNLSGVASCGPDQTLSGEGAGQSATGTSVDDAGNTNSTTVSGINIDKTAPTTSANASPAANGNGWNNTDVTVSFSGSDALSGIDYCDADVLLNTEGASQSASGTCTDNAGNISAPASATVNIDKTAPTVALVGGPVDGGIYYFGFVPGAPTCSASDALSGLDGDCSLSGYSSAIGDYTVTASVSDKAGNPASDSASYSVLAWTIKGFFAPVDMGIHNLVKGGATVPLKFEVFAGDTELTDVNIVDAFTQRVSCTEGPGDAIETYATGETSLRYDTAGGQFVFNWKTAKSPATCYRVTMKTDDGSSITADFTLK